MYVTIVKKNTDKDLIKFPKGLDLNKAQTRYRQQRYKGESMSGISSWKYADKWFILPKGMGIFKNYASDGDEQDRNMRMLNELLCQELAKQFGIECAEYELSHYENDRGLITYNVLKDRERLLSGRTLSEITKCYSDNTLSGYNNMLKKKWIVTRKERNKIVYGLYKQAIFDLMTFQTDRHAGNVFFIQNKISRKIKLAPLMDNEFAFGRSYLFYREDRENLPLNLIDNIYRNNSSYGLQVRYCFGGYKEQIEELYKVVKDKEEIKKDISSRILNIDVDKAIKNIEEKGAVVGDDYKKYVKNLIAYSKECFKEVFEIKEQANDAQETKINKQEESFEM